MGEVSQIYRKHNIMSMGKNHAFLAGQGQAGDNETTDHCLITD